MCGFLGAFCSGGYFEGSDYAKFFDATELLHSRGPDDSGFLKVDMKQGKIQNRNGFDLFLGHRRLAVLDLTPAGHQPMVSDCGQYVLMFNGEVYNYLEIRTLLEKEGIVFRTNTDTEVVLRALMVWGDRAFWEFNGMWALAFIDLQGRSILLSRDRFSEKPLYYYQNSQGVFFGSEIKALCQASHDRFRVNAIVTARFLGQSLLQAQNETFFVGIRKVPSASTLLMKINADGSLTIHPPVFYWKYPNTTNTQLSESEIIEKVRAQFLEAVKLRLRSDVPIGALLSGGLDSSSIVATAYQIGISKNITLFSAVSDDPQYSEENYVDIMSQSLGQPVQKIMLNPDPVEGLALLRQAILANDEPVGDYSVAAHFLLMHRAKELGVTVLLSGQGGDELLCGYAKYFAFYLQSLARQGNWSKLAGTIISLGLPPFAWVREFHIAEAKRYLLKNSFTGGGVDVFGPCLQGIEWFLDTGLGQSTLQERQIKDLSMYSVPALTQYEDRMSMATSREIRLPFLDHHLVDLLLPIPTQLKLHKGRTKWIFRKAMESVLPREIVWRYDKKGFSNPIGKWMRSEWKTWMNNLLSEKLVTAEFGLIQQDAFKQIYSTFCEAKNPWIGVKDVFNPLVLELWAREYKKYLC